MVITYYGHEFFKVQFGDLVLAVNPISKDSKLKSSRFGADICLVSLNDPDMNGVEQIGFGEKQPFVVRGPGEYEVKEVFVRGFPAGLTKEGKRNSMYTVVLEGMNLCFLGALPAKELSSETKAALGDIDILFVPIGGGDVLGAAEAYKLAVSLEPRLIIPMHAGEGSAGNTARTAFLKEAGEEAEEVDKLTLKKKDLEGKEGEIVVLKSLS